MNNTVIDTTKITRIEVIDENGRSYSNRHPDNKVSLHIQDEGHTLKIFIEKH